MKKKIRFSFIRTGIMFLLFALFTIVMLHVDVRAIGPQQSRVGLATINKSVFELFGENLLWDKITDFTVGIAILLAVGFIVLGLAQWITRKSLKRVNAGILALGVLYLSIFGFYVFFEIFVVNYRPVILETSLEVSFPSTHTLMTLCIMSAAMMQFSYLLKNKTVRVSAYLVSIIIVATTAVGRLLAGVHWFTDVAGGLFLGAALVMLYDSTARYIDYRRHSSV